MRRSTAALVYVVLLVICLVSVLASAWALTLQVALLGLLIWIGMAVFGNRFSRLKEQLRDFLTEPGEIETYHWSEFDHDRSVIDKEVWHRHRRRTTIHGERGDSDD